MSMVENARFLITPAPPLSLVMIAAICFCRSVMAAPMSMPLLLVRVPATLSAPNV